MKDEDYNKIDKDIFNLKETKYERQHREIYNGLVACDNFCGAKENPETLEEYKATLDHYKNHSYLSGCSHAC